MSRTSRVQWGRLFGTGALLAMVVIARARGAPALECALAPGGSWTPDTDAGVEEVAPTEWRAVTLLGPGVDRRFYRLLAPEGSDPIAHSQANYHASWSYPYDISATEGYHPDHDVEPQPYTSAAGLFAPNGYGLHDMAGNVWEWCWDRYDSIWYGRAAAGAADCRGPVAGSSRVSRGGSWDYCAIRVRCAVRNWLGASTRNNATGFRCARRGP